MPEVLQDYVEQNQDTSKMNKDILKDIALVYKQDITKHVDNIKDKIRVQKGVLIENYCAEELLRMFGYLSYWTRKNDDNGNKAEVDFVIQIGTELIPIAVKSGRNQAQSLKIYNELFHPKYMLKIGDYNFGISDNLITIPLYATFLIKDVLEKRK